MKLEIHILQNFAPSNLNRDDTGSPKDCELGGVRRARVSSQCLKRAIRSAFADQALIPEAERATRTKRIVEAATAQVVAAKKCDPTVAERAVVRALAGAGLKTDEATGKTQYLLFLPAKSISAFADLVAANLDVLAAEATPNEESKGKAKAKRQEKAEGKAQVPADLRESIVKLFSDGERTPELALFGRMIADAPDWNVDAACQVAHAISTHRVSMEFDFYTAIDDLKRDDSSGSDMMGTIPFNSACFYRYLVVDTDDLAGNLGTDAAARDQGRRTVEALVRAATLAIPTGKQNSMAAHNLPSLVLTSVRAGGEPRSLANAFVKPIRPSAELDLVEGSIAKLGGHLAALDAAYGKQDRKDFFFAVDDTSKLSGDFAKRTGATDVASLDALVSSVTQALFGAQ